MTASLFSRIALILWSLIVGVAAHAQGPARADDYRLGAGDLLRIQVFQNPELTTEARVAESGVISFPLAGIVKVAGLSPAAVEQLLAQRLREGGFIRNPQVTLNILQFRSQQVSVLGNVRTPGRYPMETTGMRLSEVIALAGGITVEGSDQIVLMTNRSGRMERYEIDLVEMFSRGNLDSDMTLSAGDVVYVGRAAQYYVYGQVQRPGMYAVDRGLTVAQAIAKGGGLTLRGTDKGVRVHRRYGDRTVQVLEPKLDDPVMSGDLIFVRESIF